MLSFEERVIDLATSEDEYVSRILAVAKRYMMGQILDVASALDDIHESAHVAMTQQWCSGPARREERAQAFREAEGA